MRRELEILERIDDFLDGEISKEVLIDDLKDLKNLDEQIQIQKELRIVIKKEAFITQSQKSLSKLKFLKSLKLVLITLAIIGSGISTFFLFNSAKEANVGVFVEPENEKINLIAISDSLIQSQYFEINNFSDTFIVTKEGMILSIPQNAFTTFLSPIYQLEIKAAFSPAEIVKGGLSTMADNELLETGGMFKITASQNGEMITLKDSNFIEFFVPTVKPIPGMQGYRGELTDEGEINWTQPKELNNVLTPTSITNLNFYPPEYDSYLRNKNWLKNGKNWTDSVYYDLAKMNSIDKAFKVGDTLFNYIFNNLINPHLIKAFCNSQFNHTLLATKEFENRMLLIHKTGDQNILSLYTSNLSKNMYEIDSLAIDIAPKEYKDEFRSWQCLKQGKLPHDKSQTKLIKLEEALQKSKLTQGELNSKTKYTYYKGKLFNEDLLYYFNIDVPLVRRKAIIENDRERYKRLTDNLKEEKASGARISSNHGAPIRSDITIKIKNAHQFKRKMCFAYMLKKDAYSFEKINITKGVLNIEHQNISNYKLVIVGLSKGKQWLLIPDKIENGTVELVLETEKSFNEKINQIGSLNRFKDNLKKDLVEAYKTKRIPGKRVDSNRFKIAKYIYSFSIDTVIKKNDINVYEKNRFTIQTMDYDWISQRASAIPTKNSSEINFIKGFLNTKEFKINRFTKDKFKVEIYDELGTDILKEKFYLTSRKTDEDTRQQNLSFGWAIKNDMKLSAGEYKTKLYFERKLISTKKLIVKQQ